MSRLTVKERVMLHLCNFSHLRDEYEVVLEVTQEGIAEEVDIKINHVPRAMKVLMEEELILVRTAPIRGGKRRRKSYFLTDRGLLETNDFRKLLEEAEVQIIDGNKRTTSTIGDLRRLLGSNVQYLHVFNHVDEDGCFHMNSFCGQGIEDRGTEPQTYTLFGEVPWQDEFFGREHELEQLQEWLDSSAISVIVIAGVDGQGKKSLMARLLEDYIGERHIFWNRCNPWDDLVDLTEHVARFLESLRRPALKALMRTRRTWDERAVMEELRKEMCDMSAIVFIGDIMTCAGCMPIVKEIIQASRLNPELKLVLSTTDNELFRNRYRDHSGDFIRIMNLEGLKQADARYFFKDSLSDRQLEMLVNLSNGHPRTLKSFSRLDLSNITSKAGEVNDDQMMIRFLQNLESG